MTRVYEACSGSGVDVVAAIVPKDTFDGSVQGQSPVKMTTIKVLLTVEQKVG